MNLASCNGLPAPALFSSTSSFVDGLLQKAWCLCQVLILTSQRRNIGVTHQNTDGEGIQVLQGLGRKRMA